MKANTTIKTVQDLHDLYDYFNKLYFDNKLPNHFPIRFFTPRSNTVTWGFVTHVSTRHGHPNPRHDVTDLQINRDLIKDQKTLKRVMLHEMVHVMQAEVRKENPTHRKFFKAMIRHLNVATKERYGVIS